MNIVTLPPKLSASRSRNTRISSDSVWPLRRADGRTWAEAHSAAHGAARKKEQTDD